MSVRSAIQASDLHHLTVPCGCVTLTEGGSS
jgi:hypothetical protein